MLYRLLLDVIGLCVDLANAGLLLVGAGFLALIAIKAYDLVGPPHWRNHLPRAFLPEAELPAVLVQIPVFNEHEVAIGAMHAACALDWPRDRLHVQILDDSTDESVEMVATAATELQARGFLVEHRHRTRRAGFKAGALAEGLTATHEPFVAMLDVDFRPPRHWLRDVIPVLLADADAGFIQSRCEFSNYRTNWLTRVQGMMLDAHFMVEQAGRYRGGWLFQFNGTGGVWRREAIAEAGGWSSDSLVEDLDLTIRVALAGWHGLFMSEPAIPGLVPERVSHWRVQQRRWSTGFIEVARKLLPTILRAPWSAGFKLSAAFLIFVQAFYACLAVGIVAVAAGTLQRNQPAQRHQDRAAEDEAGPGIPIGADQPVGLARRRWGAVPPLAHHHIEIAGAVPLDRHLGGGLAVGGVEAAFGRHVGKGRAVRTGDRQHRPLGGIVRALHSGETDFRLKTYWPTCRLWPTDNGLCSIDAAGGFERCAQHEHAQPRVRQRHAPLAARQGCRYAPQASQRHRRRASFHPREKLRKTLPTISQVPSASPDRQE